MSKGFASSYRIVLLAAGFLACFAAVGTRLVWLHVVDRERWLGAIEDVRSRFSEEKARRGNILDARGTILATSSPTIVVGVDPSFLLETDEQKRKWPELAALLGMPERELFQIFTTKYRAPAPEAPPGPGRVDLVFNLDAPARNDAGPAPKKIQWVKLAENISPETMAAIDSLGIRGVRQEMPAPYRRVYPNKQLASHLVGFVNRDELPLAGIEYYADFFLRGQNGWREGERDGRRRELAQFGVREVAPANGYDVKLTIDATVQSVIEQELTAIVRKFNPLKATIIVSEPATGFILGMANYPTFDLNAYNEVPGDRQAAMKNIAVTDVYEPGSVFKIVAAAGALEDRLVRPQTVFDCELETVMHRGRKVLLPKEDHHMGELTVAQVISHSSNKGAAQLALKLGEPRFYEYIRKFGFGGTLGFPFGGEVPGLLSPPKAWVPIDITRIAMGHTIAATALQMHQAMTVIANDGVLLRPQIIREVIAPSGETVYRYRPEEMHRVVSPETARQVATMLMDVASTDGTAVEAAIPGFDAAGKTGTTQKLVEEIRADGTKRLVYSNKHHVASFVGFFPAGRPQVAISVIVDDAQVLTNSRTAYGRVVAAPSFKNIGERLIPIRDIKPVTRSAERFTVATAGTGGRR